MNVVTLDAVSDLNMLAHAGINHAPRGSTVTVLCDSLVQTRRLGTSAHSYAPSQISELQVSTGMPSSVSLIS